LALIHLQCKKTSYGISRERCGRYLGVYSVMMNLKKELSRRAL
jgi:hypothetical protein